MNDLFRTLHRYRARVETALRQHVVIADPLLARMVSYHLGWVDADGRPTNAESGKRLRAILCLLAAEAAGGSATAALPLAAGIELLHNFSLIHDDIQDRSTHRHNRLTVWKIWGIAQAINAGDALFALAHRAVASLPDGGVEPTVALRAIRWLDEVAVRLCEGQTMDLAFPDRPLVTVDEYLQMIGGKTAALLGYSLGAGALIAGAAEAIVADYTRAGEALGLAFQIRDDMLGIWGDPVRTGKTRGEDLREGKRSLPVVYALQADETTAKSFRQLLADAGQRDEAVAAAIDLLDRIDARVFCQALAEQHEQDALTRLERIAMAAPGEAAMATLRQLAMFVVRRDF